MNFVQLLWGDESGSILTTETVLLGTVVVVGTTVGLHQVADAVNAELGEVSGALRALDQSYSFKGFKSCRAETAGSSYTQPERDECESHRREEHKRHELRREEHKRHKDRRDDDKKPQPRREDRRDDDRRDDDKQPESRSKDRRENEDKPEPRTPRRPEYPRRPENKRSEDTKPEETKPVDTGKPKPGGN